MRLLPRSPAELQRVRRHIGGHAPRSIAEFRSPEQLTISMRRGVRLLRAVRLQAELREPPRQDSFCRAHLVEAGCQVPRQHLGPFRQAFGARQVGIPRGARLLHKAPHLFQFGLLILGQLPSANRTQADLGVRQALIDGRVVLFLLIGCKDIAQNGRWRRGRRWSWRIRLRWRGGRRCR